MNGRLSIKTQLALTLAVAFMIFLAINALLVNQYLLTTFSTLEKVIARGNDRRALQLLEAELWRIGLHNRENAGWDDAYAFAKGELGYEFFERNYGSGDYLLEARLDLVSIYSVDRKLLATTMLRNRGVTNRSLADISDAFRSRMDQVLDMTSTADRHSGIVPTSHGPMLVVVLPILDSNYDGPIAGYWLEGRFVDESLLSDASRALGAEMSVTEATPAGQPDGVPDFTGIRRLPDSSDIQVTRDILETRTLLVGMFGGTSYLLQTSTPRVIFDAGVRAILLILVTFMLLTLLFFFLVWSLLFDRQVIRPIQQLTRHIQLMRSSGDLKSPIKATGYGELRTLADQFRQLTTELDAARTTLAESRDEAVRLAQVKGEFLANMSHELRTPLHGLMGMSQLLLESDLSPPQREQARHLHATCLNLARIIDGILDLAMIEGGEFTLEENVGSPGRLLRDTVELFRGNAESKHLELHSHVAEDVPELVIGDPNRIGQVLNHLVSNALKFTAQGSITASLGVETKPDANDVETRWLRFAVQDTGIGIPPEKREAIFEAFVQGDLSKSKRYAGTGIGLTICRSLVKHMGGNLQLVSEVGVGSTFAFAIPLKLPPD